MPSAPTRFEVEHLHRLVPALHQWSEAAQSLDEAVEQLASELERVAPMPALRLVKS